jgi:DNA-binding GntR family transcriptional regulator
MVVNRRPSLRSEVYRAVREAVIRGDFQPGAKLNGSDLAARLGVSRTPVREALQRLIQEGLAENDDAGVVYVRKPTLENVKDFFELRARLESTAAELCAMRATPDEKAELRRIHESLIAARATDDYVERGLKLNYDFHRAVQHASHNALMATAVEAIAAAISPAWLTHFYLRTGTTYDQTVEEHGAILEAIATGDSRRASRLMERHVQRASDEILGNLVGETALLAPTLSDSGRR